MLLVDGASLVEQVGDSVGSLLDSLGHLGEVRLVGIGIGLRVEVVAQRLHILDGSVQLVGQLAVGDVLERLLVGIVDLVAHGDEVLDSLLGSLLQGSGLAGSGLGILLGIVGQQGTIPAVLGGIGLLILVVQILHLLLVGIDSLLGSVGSLGQSGIDVVLDIVVLHGGLLSHGLVDCLFGSVDLLQAAGVEAVLGLVGVFQILVQLLHDAQVLLVQVVVLLGSVGNLLLIGTDQLVGSLLVLFETQGTCVVLLLEELLHAFAGIEHLVVVIYAGVDFLFESLLDLGLGVVLLIVSLLVQVHHGDVELLGMHGHGVQVGEHDLVERDLVGEVGSGIDGKLLVSLAIVGHEHVEADEHAVVAIEGLVATGHEYLVVVGLGTLDGDDLLAQSLTRLALGIELDAGGIELQACGQNDLELNARNLGSGLVLQLHLHVLAVVEQGVELQLALGIESSAGVDLEGATELGLVDSDLLRSERVVALSTFYATFALVAVFNVVSLVVGQVDDRQTHGILASQCVVGRDLEGTERLELLELADGGELAVLHHVGIDHEVEALGRALHLRLVVLQGGQVSHFEDSVGELDTCGQLNVDVDIRHVVALGLDHQIHGLRLVESNLGLFTILGEVDPQRGVASHDGSQCACSECKGQGYLLGKSVCQSFDIVNHISYCFFIITYFIKMGPMGLIGLIGPHPDYYFLMTFCVVPSARRMMLMPFFRPFIMRPPRL